MCRGGILCYCIHYGNLFKEIAPQVERLPSLLLLLLLLRPCLPPGHSPASNSDPHHDDSWRSALLLSSPTTSHSAADKPERNPNLCAPDEVINNQGLPGSGRATGGEKKRGVKVTEMYILLMGWWERRSPTLPPPPSCLAKTSVVG